MVLKTQFNLDPHLIKCIGLLYASKNLRKGDVPPLQKVLERVLYKKYGVKKDYTAFFQSQLPPKEGTIIIPKGKKKKCDTSKRLKNNENVAPNKSMENLLGIELVCIKCKENSVAPDNRLLECKECNYLYHQECHQPLVYFYKENWTCTDCKQLKLSKFSVNNREQIQALQERNDLTHKGKSANVEKSRHASLSSNFDELTEQASTVEVPVTDVVSSTVTTGPKHVNIDKSKGRKRLNSSPSDRPSDQLPSNTGSPSAKSLRRSNSPGMQPDQLVNMPSTQLEHKHSRISPSESTFDNLSNAENTRYALPTTRDKDSSLDNFLHIPDDKQMSSQTNNSPRVESRVSDTEDKKYDFQGHLSPEITLIDNRNPAPELSINDKLASPLLRHDISHMTTPLIDAESNKNSLLNPKPSEYTAENNSQLAPQTALNSTATPEGELASSLLQRDISHITVPVIDAESNKNSLLNPKPSEYTAGGNSQPAPQTALNSTATPEGELASPLLRHDISHITAPVNDAESNKNRPPKSNPSRYTAKHNRSPAPQTAINSSFYRPVNTGQDLPSIRCSLSGNLPSAKNPDHRLSVSTCGYNSRSYATGVRQLIQNGSALKFPRAHPSSFRICHFPGRGQIIYTNAVPLVQYSAGPPGSVMMRNINCGNQLPTYSAGIPRHALPVYSYGSTPFNYNFNQQSLPVRPYQLGMYMSPGKITTPYGNVSASSGHSLIQRHVQPRFGNTKLDAKIHTKNVPRPSSYNYAPLPVQYGMPPTPSTGYPLVQQLSQVGTQFSPQHISPQTNPRFSNVKLNGQIPSMPGPSTGRNMMLQMEQK